MSFQNFVIFLIVGALAGWISGLITKGKGFGLPGNMIVGIIGAFLGGFCFNLLGLGATISSASSSAPWWARCCSSGCCASSGNNRR